MVTRAFYITADKVGIVTGGGTVTKKEAEALGADTLIFDREAVDPTHLDRTDPFIFDQLALARIELLLAAGTIPRIAHFYAGTFGATIRRLRQAGVKVAYTCAAHDRKASIEEFERHGHAYPFAHIRDDALFARYIDGYLQADVLVCPSQHSADVMRGYGCSRVVVIPHGVVERASAPAPMPKTFRVGYFGAIGYDKGLRYLLEAWKRLAYTDATLLLGGRDSEDALPWIRGHGGGNIQVVGYVETLASFHNRCSVYVQPSVTEGFGIEILEAMAYGRPVICSTGAGGVDVVTDGVTGFRVPIRSPEKIAERIAWCREHPAEVVEMGRNAHKLTERYTWTLVQDQYRAAWNNLLGERFFA